MVRTRTNNNHDDELVAQAMARAGVKTKKAAVEAALRAYVRKPDYSSLLALVGSDLGSDEYDPKARFTHPRHGEALSVQDPEPAYKAVRRGRPSSPRK